MKLTTCCWPNASLFSYCLECFGLKELVREEARLIKSVIERVRNTERPSPKTRCCLRRTYEFSLVEGFHSP